MALSVVVLVSLVAAALAAVEATYPQPGMPQPSSSHPAKEEHHAPAERIARTLPYDPYVQEDPAKYVFSYLVQDDYNGASFGHQETRNGYDTQGSYYFPLPDGRVQKVTYFVNGDSGYIAKVTYESPYPPAYGPSAAYRSDPESEPAAEN